MSVANFTNPIAKAVKGPSLRAFAPSRGLRRVYHAACNLFDRLLHPRRHSVACRRLANAQRPGRILVVCHGNICRSPYLQAVLQRSLPDVVVSSAGFAGSNRPVPLISLALSAQRGLDLSAYRSQLIAQKHTGGADLVIVMDSNQARRIERTFRIRRERIVIAGDLDPMRTAGRAILDPWKQSIEAFESSFDRLDRCAATLVSVLRPTK